MNVGMAIRVNYHFFSPIPYELAGRVSLYALVGRYVMCVEIFLFVFSCSRKAVQSEV